MGRPAARARHGVRDDPVLRPVAAADDVARPRGRERDAVPLELRRREEAPPVRRDHELGGALRHRVDVVAAHRLVLAVAPEPLAVLVALVARHDDDGAGPALLPERLEHVGGPEHVRRHRLHRLLVGEPDERLRGEVEHEVGARLAEHRAEPRRGRGRRRRRAGRRARPRRPRRATGSVSGARAYPVTSAPRLAQPEREPAALEAGVPGEEDALPRVGAAELLRRWVRPSPCLPGRLPGRPQVVQEPVLARRCPSAARSRCAGTRRARGPSRGAGAAPARRSCSGSRAEVLPDPLRVEDEEAAVDEALGGLGLLVELGDPAALDQHLAEAAGRPHRGRRSRPCRAARWNSMVFAMSTSETPSP